MTYPHKYKMELVTPMVINGTEITRISRAILICEDFYVLLSPKDTAANHARSIWCIHGAKDVYLPRDIGWYPAPPKVLNAPVVWDDLSLLDMANVMGLISDTEAHIHYNSHRNEVMQGVADDLEAIFNTLQTKTGIPTNELTRLIRIHDNNAITEKDNAYIEANDLDAELFSWS